MPEFDCPDCGPWVSELQLRCRYLHRRQQEQQGLQKDAMSNVTTARSDQETASASTEKHSKKPRKTGGLARQLTLDFGTTNTKATPPSKKALAPAGPISKPRAPVIMGKTKLKELDLTEDDLAEFNKWYVTTPTELWAGIGRTRMEYILHVICPDIYTRTDNWEIADARVILYTKARKYQLVDWLVPPLKLKYLRERFQCLMEEEEKRDAEKSSGTTAGPKVASQGQSTFMKQRDMLSKWLSTSKAPGEGTQVAKADDPAPNDSRKRLLERMNDRPLKTVKPGNDAISSATNSSPAVSESKPKLPHVTPMVGQKMANLPPTLPPVTPILGQPKTILPTTAHLSRSYCLAPGQASSLIMGSQTSTSSILLCLEGTPGMVGVGSGGMCFQGWPLPMCKAILFAPIFRIVNNSLTHPCKVVSYCLEQFVARSISQCQFQLAYGQSTCWFESKRNERLLVFVTGNTPHPTPHALLEAKKGPLRSFPFHTLIPFPMADTEDGNKFRVTSDSYGSVISVTIVTVQA